ncbi:unnamed protein product [Sphenostylis stenocarpa]|uniref:Uncharacterized protein n=1 Tax=Sphenostylis stenocarpa TaxID=92480 RepID=A0AA86V964_9FABA|nr:unnamed protein product [Sphenostylis stenocarpa]
MAKFQTVHRCFFIFIALVACHGSFLAHGRKIKSLNQHSSPNTNTVANNIPSPKTYVEPPQYEGASKLEESSGADNTNAFRPTTPGGSPGVGHGIITSEYHNNMKSMVAVQSPDVEVFVTEGSKYDFKPTDPGHSPGVGHAYLTKIGQEN